MSTTEWTMVVAGSAAIAWVNWYFFFAGRRPLRRAQQQAEPGEKS